MSNDDYFEIMPQSWAKRRRLTEPLYKVLEFQVQGFKKIDGHRCSIKVVFDDGDSDTLKARVYANKTHQIVDGKVEELITSWGVQGTNPNGVSLVLRYIQ